MRCLKCGNTDIETNFKNRGDKIYWSEHDEIRSISSFTINDRYYSADKIIKECLVLKCNTCGFKHAKETNDK